MSNYQLRRSAYSRKSKYIDFKINGRLFPSWILKNFSKYKLPPIIKKSGVDPCKEKIKKELHKYQMFISQYLDFNSPYRDILIYHGLGSGKTASAINIYNVLYNYTPGWNVFILIKAALKSTWLTELKYWLSKDERDFRFKNIVFVHYDSPFADKKFMEAMNDVDASKKSMYIIDEVHNFIRNVYSNISTNKGRRAQVVYDYIIQEKQENPDTRVVLLSGTPAINNPFELGLLFNLLRPDIFPRSEPKFNHLFITESGFKTLSKHNKNMFQRRIMGLVSHYIGSSPDYYASKTFHHVEVIMSEYQEEIYTHYEQIEAKISMKARHRGKDGPKLYKSYTRQACNFVFPSISQNITGENRPRPSKFRISEREATLLEESRETTSLKVEQGKVLQVTKYKKALKLFISGFDNYLDGVDSKDKKARYTIIDDLKKFLGQYKGNFEEFITKEKRTSHLLKAMMVGSTKMTNIVFNVIKSRGPVLIYSNYVLMEAQHTQQETDRTQHTTQNTQCTSHNTTHNTTKNNT